MAKADLPSWVEPELATLTRDRFSDPYLVHASQAGRRTLPGLLRAGRVRLDEPEQAGHHQHVPRSRRGPGSPAEGHRRRRPGARRGDGGLRRHANQVRAAAAPARPRRSRPGTAPRSVPVVYHMFDVMYSDGEDTRPRLLLERKEILARAVSHGVTRPAVHRAPRRRRKGLLRAGLPRRLGGLIAKLASAPYVSGRNKNWLKFKCESGQELVVGGFTDPQRSRSDSARCCSATTTLTASWSTPGRSARVSTPRPCAACGTGWARWSRTARRSSRARRCGSGVCTGSGLSSSPRSASASGPTR